MGEITVEPAVLEAAGGSVQSVGGEIHRLGGQVTTLQPAVGAAQPQTAAALEEFIPTCSRALTLFSEMVHQFGVATRKAGAGYRETDRCAIPAVAAGGSGP